MMAAGVKAEEAQQPPVKPDDESVIENLDILEMLDILEEDDPEMLDNLDTLQNMNPQEES
jgi:hypothetical protein